MTAILTIALGIGAASTMFSVVKAVLLNPLPYADPSRLAWVASLSDSGGEIRSSLPDIDDWRAQSTAFAALAAYSDAPFVAGGGESPERTAGAIVTEDFFAALGVALERGRWFSAAEHAKGNPLGSVIIGHGLWQQVYGGDPQIVGRRITVLGFPSTVIGVMPAGFAYPAGCELWLSARALGEGAVRTAHNFWVIGRLRPGVGFEAAASELHAIARRLNTHYPGPYQTSGARIEPLESHLNGSVRMPLLLLCGAVGILLLIVCVNVANLLLVRNTARSHEFAVRLAIGGRAIHLVRQTLFEGWVLAAAGGTLGLLLTAWSIDLIRALLPATVPRAADVAVDAPVLAFAAMLAAATGFCFSLLPALRASRANLREALKTASRTQSASRASQRMQSALVVSEVALSMVLLAGAGLLISSFLRLRSIHPGFDPSNVLVADVSFPATGPDRARLAFRYGEILDRLAAVPGVHAAGTIKDLPFTPLQRNGTFAIESRQAASSLDANFMIVSPGLTEALRIPLVRGRLLARADTSAPAGVALINAEMARRFWPGRDPIGERIWFSSFDPKPNWLTIVGIVGDVRQTGFTAAPQPAAYVSYSHLQIAGYLNSANVIVRTAGDPKIALTAVRQAIREVVPGAAASFRLMDDLVADTTSRQRFQIQVLGAFATMALLLAAVGLYGVLSYTVAANTASIGIRIALGARPSQVFAMVAGRAARLALLGTTAGLAACLAIRELLARVVYGISPSDPFILGSTAALMFAIALLASWLPARRAVAVDPVAAMRD